MLTLGLVQSAIGALVFLLRKPRHLSNRLLALWLGIMALNFLGLLLPQGMVSYLKIGFLPLLLLYGPILFFYVKSLITEDFRFRRRDAWHLLPFLTLSILRLFIYPQSFEYDQYLSGSLNVYGTAIILAIFLSLTGYWLVTLFLLARHRRNLRNHFSYRSQKLALDWIWLIVLLFIVNQVVGYFAPSLQNLFPDQERASFWLLQFNLVIFAYLLTVFGLLQPLIFTGEAPKAVKDKEDLHKNKYRRSGLKEEQVRKLSQRIEDYLLEKKPYLAPEYNLQTMSLDLEEPRQNLSQTINEVFGKNFYQLINTYRVEEVKRLLQTKAGEQMTLEALAYEAGFNSKASFYRVFKEFTGQTPAAYRRHIGRI